MAAFGVWIIPLIILLLLVYNIGYPMAVEMISSVHSLRNWFVERWSSRMKS